MRKATAIRTIASVTLFFIGSATLNASSPRACDLLDAQMAASLVGGKVDAPMDAGFSCIYADTSTKAWVMFSVSDASARDAENFLQTHGGAKQGDTYESIPSLPSKNLLIVTSDQKDCLTVFLHGKEINLFVHRPMTPALKATMVQFTNRILARL